MTHARTHRRLLASATALSLGLALTACGGMADNRSLYSIHQPVIERSNYAFDINAGYGGLDTAEQMRLAGWFEAIGLRYGDRVAIDDPAMSGATRDAVASIAKRYGILLADSAPVTEGQLAPGQARVVVTRSSAAVPGCPDWAAQSDTNLNNATYSNYGCAVNANMAAMVANPEDLVNGQRGTGQTTVMSASKAISTYREAEPTGKAGLSQTSSTEGGN